MSASFRVVWIIGAGFSRSLGGPLLDHFFSEPLRARVVARWEQLRSDVDNLHKLYRTHERGLSQWIHPWADAEQFSELIEAAALPEKSPVRERARALLRADAIDGSPDYGVLRDACRRYFAAACHEFMLPEDVVEGLERWKPYLRWGKELGPQDSIISFNYDTVVETACRNTDLRVVLPSDGSAIEPDYPQLLKLHGSVSWEQSNRGVRKVDPETMLAEGRVPVIATPGPSKLDSTNHLFSGLWQQARLTLRRADIVVFVGYRFPASDVEAKRQLLSALADNKQQSLVVRIVLGPDRSQPDVVRLHELVGWALRKRSAALSGSLYDPVRLVDPLWAEDFLSVVERGRLPS